MKDLREYKDLIRKSIVGIKDSNWKWKLQCITDTKVSIRWGYLDYCQEESNCFYIEISDMNDEDSPEECFLVSRTPEGLMIEGHLVCDTPTASYQETYERAIQSCINEIVHYAHNRY